MSAYVLYKIDFFFKTIFGQCKSFFFSDSSWLITFTNSLRVKNKKTDSYPVHSITQIDQSCCVNIKKRGESVLSIFFFSLIKNSSTTFALNRRTAVLSADVLNFSLSLWSPCCQNTKIGCCCFFSLFCRLLTGKINASYENLSCRNKVKM